ncbi:MAG: chromosome partitioning protein ParB [Lentisphaerae bacterium]|nr:chromosome partitioning protein ParB [Lentisphaerota bacterium]
MQVAVNSIIVTDRVRQEVGDVGPLTDSMKLRGQLNPITITRGNELVAGYRRLLAARKLGWEHIDANIVHRDSEIEKLEMQLEENVHRKDFSPQELLEGYRRLERLRRPNIFRRIGRFLGGIFTRLFRRRTGRDKLKPEPRGPAAGYDDWGAP